MQKSTSIQPNLKDATNPLYKGSRAYTHKWAGIVPSQNGVEPNQTGYNISQLQEIGKISV